MNLAEHETPLTQLPDTPLWAENYALLFYDPAQAVSSVFSIGRWGSNTSLWRATTSLTLDNGRVLLGNNYGRSPQPHLVDAGTAGIEILEPHKRIRYWYDGPAFDRDLASLYQRGFQSGQMSRLQLELIFTSDQQYWDLKSHAAKAYSDDDVFCADGRIEQLGNVSGEFRYGSDSPIALQNVPALRDHSAGIRDVALLRRHLWAQGHFPNGRRFMVYMVEGTTTGHMLNRACILEGGKLYEATVSTSDGFLETMADRDRPFSLEINAPDFGSMTVRATELSGALPLGVVEPADLVWGVPQAGKVRRWMNEQRVRWIWDGIEGSGNLERSTPSALEESENASGYQELVEARR